jgi:hypothetical protein
MMSNRIDPDSATKTIYQEQRVAAYSGNPLLEALPPIRSTQEITTALTSYPPYDKAQRHEPTEIRKHYLDSLRRIVVPLPNNLDLVGRIDRLIRKSYVDRNPIDPQFRSTFELRVGAFQSLTADGVKRRHGQINGLTLVGISGVGKTTAVESGLDLYPQVIRHTRYHDRALPLSQLVWIKLECPHNGSLKGLCINFFQRIDAKLGTNYQGIYAGGRVNVDTLVGSMARVALAHGLGMLVIDEIQHLSQAASGGEESMLNFFVQLANTIGVPVVLVGTPKAIPLFAKSFRQARRGTGEGDMIWDRMSRGPVWDLLCDAIWPYQYTRQTTKLTAELREALFEETQGICDLLIKLYYFAQMRAMELSDESKTGDESITPRILRSVARDRFLFLRPFLNVLKERRPDVLRRTDDLYLPSDEKKKNTKKPRLPSMDDIDLPADDDDGDTCAAS